jgi:ribosomal protein S27AE
LSDTSQSFTLEQKLRTRRQTRWAIESGKLTPQPCERCGAPETIAHHPDYSKPFDVEWLCGPCHAEEHRVYPVTKTCEVCGAEFTPHRTKRKRAKTCSWECRNALLSAVMSEVRSTPEYREKARQLAFKTGAAERAKTMVQARWAKRDAR